MKEFQSIPAFVAHLERLALESRAVAEFVAKKGAEEIKETAKGMIGFYQQEIKNFPAWPDLAESTEREKAAMGYHPDAPLLASGEMRDSFKSTVEVTPTGATAVVGTDDIKMVWHEEGTFLNGKLHVPSRPVMGPAGAHSAPRINRLAAECMSAWLAGKAWENVVITYTP